MARVETAMFPPFGVDIYALIRPFEARDPFKPKEGAGIGVSPSIEPGEPFINIVGGSDSAYTSAPAPAALGYTVEWTEDINQRQAVKERIENPDDPTQFVEVEKITRFSARNNMTGEQININIDRRNITDDRTGS